MSDKNDLLRRQDCINAIEEITSSMSVCVNTDECHGMKRMQRQAVIELANMPAVQPEPSDLIDRQAALDAISEHGTIWMSYTDDMSACEIAMEAISNAKDTIIRIIKGLPSVQPEAHEGRWIGGDGSYICSECNGSPLDFIDTIGASFDACVETPMNYCPNCGAKMKGE